MVHQTTSRSFWEAGWRSDFPPLRAMMPCPVFPMMGMNFLSLIFHLLEQWCLVIPLYKHTVAISPVLMMSSGFAPLLINIFACSWHRLLVFILVTLIFCQSSHTPERISQPRKAQQKRMLSEVNSSSNSHRNGMHQHLSDFCTYFPFRASGLSKTPKFTLLAWWTRTTRRSVSFG